MLIRKRKTEYRVLNREECATIHAASLEMLERTGCSVQSRSAVELLKQAGCSVDGDRVRLPGSLVKWALHSAPQKVALNNRLGRRAMILEGSNTYYGTGSDCLYTMDLETGARRRSRKADVANFARLVDGLPHLDFVMSMAVPEEVKEGSTFVHEFQAMAENTTKPIVFTAHGIEDMKAIYDMAAAVKGGEEALQREPFILLYSEPIPPQVHSEMGIEKLIFCAKRHIPVTYPTGSMAGATAPATLAGAIALGNAETLVGLVIAQLARPGAPFVCGGNTSIMDMPTGCFTYGAPEFHLAFSAYADLAKFYGLPVWGLAGATDAKLLDAQAGMELGVQILMAELSGAQLIHDVGYLDSGLCSSLEMVCLGNEMAAMAQRISRGVEVSPETLALDVVDEIGPAGNFLETEHTLKHYRNESWFPAVLTRCSTAEWNRQGSPDVRQLLNRQARDILAHHQPAPLSAGVREKLAAIVAQREASL